jgi:hypothetical protein
LAPFIEKEVLENVVPEIADQLNDVLTKEVSDSVSKVRCFPFVVFFFQQLTVPSFFFMFLFSRALQKKWLARFPSL